MATEKKEKSPIRLNKTGFIEIPIRIMIEVEIVQVQAAGVKLKTFARAGLQEGIESFAFVITLKKNSKVRIENVTIQSETIFNDDLQDDGQGNEVGQISVSVPGTHFLLIIEATGDPFNGTTFNLTCDSAKVFVEDQELKITNSGKGNYSNASVPLP